MAELDEREECCDRYCPGCGRHVYLLDYDRVVGALKQVAKDWRYRQRAIEEGCHMDDPDVVIERHGKLAERVLPRA